MTRRIPITGYDLMDAQEVANAFGISRSSLNVALSSPDVYPTLAAILPAPLRMIGRSNVWLRSEIEAAIKAYS